MSRKAKTISDNVHSPIRFRIGSGKRNRRIFTFKWKANLLSSEISRSESFWVCNSSFNEEVMLKYLRLRYFWGHSLPIEYTAMFDHPKFLQDLEFSVALQAVATTELGKEEIMERLEHGLSLLGRKSLLRKALFSQWDNNIFLLVEEIVRSIRPHKRFSGWVRSASSIGSKRSRPQLLEPLKEEEFRQDQFDEYVFLYELISVGRIETNSGTRLSILKKPQTRGETES